jgi:hypothetical protein
MAHSIFRKDILNTIGNQARLEHKTNIQEMVFAAEPR